MKYALGVAAIVSVVAIVKAYGMSPRLAFFGSILVLFLMGILFVLANHSLQKVEKSFAPSIFLLWSIAILFIATAFLLFTSVFFNRPLNLCEWVDPGCNIKIKEEQIAIEGIVYIDSRESENVEVKILEIEKTDRTNYFGKFKFFLSSTDIHDSYTIHFRTEKLDTTIKVDRLNTSKEYFLVLNKKNAPPAKKEISLKTFTLSPVRLRKLEQHLIKKGFSYSTKKPVYIIEITHTGNIEDMGKNLFRYNGGGYQTSNKQKYL